MQKINFLEGGVCAPEGFLASGVSCGLKANGGLDLALIFCEREATCAGLFTKNLVKAECVKFSQKNLLEGKPRAVVANSGNANACTGNAGFEAAQKEAQLFAKKLNLKESEVLVCSTGVIGKPLPVQKILDSADSLVSSLSKNGNEFARKAILTTDTKFKECAVQTTIGGKTVTLGAMAKGSGMIHINLGTMLAFITTDCKISKKMLERALQLSADQTYNCISIDGDTSTNDTLLIFASGAAKNPEITTENSDFENFLQALNTLNTEMAKKIAADGEGAGRLVICKIFGAKTLQDARILAKSVVSSNLVKAAFFGADANWGRILCAMGYSGAEFCAEKTSVTFASEKGKIEVYKNGEPLDFDETQAKKILLEKEIEIQILCADGNSSAQAFGCDLTYDYVKINGDYRS